MIGELRHRSTGTRVIESDGDIGIEESFQGSGTMLGVNVSDIRSVSIFGLGGHGNGIIMTGDNETAAYERHGVGWQNETGGHSVLAAMLFKTNSQKLQRLNKIIVVTELEEEHEGSTIERLWEWK
jgi:hypothetical protein